MYMFLTSSILRCMSCNCSSHSSISESNSGLSPTHTPRCRSRAAIQVCVCVCVCVCINVCVCVCINVCVFVCVCERERVSVWVYVLRQLFPQCLFKSDGFSNVVLTGLCVWVLVCVTEWVSVCLCVYYRGLAVLSCWRCQRAQTGMIKGLQNQGRQQHKSVSSYLRGKHWPIRILYERELMNFST